MSDALSDIARDEERGKRILEHFKAIRNCLEFTGDSGKLADLRQEVIDTAKACDAVYGLGYWTEETNFAEGIAELADGLLAHDKNVWLRFLAHLAGNCLA